MRGNKGQEEGRRWNHRAHHSEESAKFFERREIQVRSRLLALVLESSDSRTGYGVAVGGWRKRIVAVAFLQEGARACVRCGCTFLKRLVPEFAMRGAPGLMAARQNHGVDSRASYRNDDTSLDSLPEADEHCGHTEVLCALRLARCLDLSASRSLLGAQQNESRALLGMARCREQQHGGRDDGEGCVLGGQGKEFRSAFATEENTSPRALFPRAVPQMVISQPYGMHRQVMPGQTSLALTCWPQPMHRRSCPGGHGPSRRNTNGDT